MFDKDGKVSKEFIAKAQQLLGPGFYKQRPGIILNSGTLSFSALNNDFGDYLLELVEEQLEDQ